MRLSLPNRHHFLVDLAPFGLDNPGEVFHVADRPYGLIEGTVLADGAERLTTGLVSGDDHGDGAARDLGRGAGREGRAARRCCRSPAAPT